MIKLALGAAGRYLPIFVALPILFIGVPLLLTFMAIGFASSLVDGSLGILIPVLAVMVAGSALVQASLARATLLYAEGRRVTFDAVFMAGMSIAPRLVALAWIAAIGTLLGTSLLILPGVILMWSVAVPLMVAEGGGIDATLERSRRLTSGRRWWIFGLHTALVVTLYFVATLAQAAGAFAVGWPGAAYVTAATFALPPLLFIIVSGTLAAAIYVELRRAHGDVDVDHLAEVFA